IKRSSAERARIKAQESQAQAQQSQEQARESAAQARESQAKANMTQEQNAQLQKQLAALKAKKTKRGLVLTLGNVLFALNKADLKPGGTRTVGRLAKFMQQYPKRNVMIEGYTDSTGAADYNQKLSERRARSVRNALVADGVDPQRVITKGFGEQYPVATNTTAAGRQQNRRVEIVISDENGDFNKSR
ncbi:MAG: OmpA family protein, partial [Gammaproteobacteria bacterium]